MAKTALVFATLMASAVAVTATAPHGGSGRGNYGAQPPHSYSVHQDVSFDPQDETLFVSAETESLAFFDDDRDDESHLSDASFADLNDDCSELRESLSLFTSDALSCNGGDQPFITMAECSFAPMLDDEDSDDDEDDDDDGSCSMLSNASIRRSIIAATVMRPNLSHRDDGSDRNHRTVARPRSARFARFSRRGKHHQASSLHSALSMRGGAVVSDGTEFARRLLVAALVTLMYEIALGHLLEFVKIVMQTSPPGTTYWDILKSITAEKGLAGIWDGFIPWGVVQSIGKGGVFGLANAVAQSLLLPLADDGKIPKQLALTLAGGIAGGFQGYVLSPTLLLKTRVMTNPVFRESMSLMRTTLLSMSIGFEVVKEEGIGALMKGSNIFALKRVFDWATRYYFSDVFESLLLMRSASGTLTAGEKISASLLGGTASTLSTLPLDVLVAKTQDAKKAGVKVSALDMFREELREHGWSGVRDSYTRGFVARLGHVCFTTVSMKVGTALLYEAMYGKR